MREKAHRAGLGALSLIEKSDFSFERAAAGLVIGTAVEFSVGAASLYELAAA